MAEDKNTPQMGAPWLIAGGFLLLVVIGVIVALIVFPGDNNDDGGDPYQAAEGDQANEDQATESAGSPPPTSEGETPAREEQAEEPVAEICDVDDADSSFPTSAPEFSWEDSPSGIVLPVSKEHGPFVKDEYFWRCTSQTVTGAVFAGPSLLVAFTAGHYDAAEDSPRARDYFDIHDLENPTFDTVHVGFRVLESTDTTATIEYLVESRTVEGSVVTTLNLVWNEEVQDWRMDLSEGEPPMEVVEDTSAYTLWR